MVADRCNCFQMEGDNPNCPMKHGPPEPVHKDTTMEYCKEYPACQCFCGCREKALGGYKKVPRREVYCDTWRSWLAQVVLIFVVYKIDPLA